MDVLAALDAIPRAQIPAAIARLAARAMEPEPPTRAPAASNGRLLTPDEAAARLGVNRRWIYRHADRLGAARLSRRKLRVPEAALERYLARQAREVRRGAG